MPCISSTCGMWFSRAGHWLVCGEHDLWINATSVQQISVWYVALAKIEKKTLENRKKVQELMFVWHEKEIAFLNLSGISVLLWIVCRQLPCRNLSLKREVWRRTFRVWCFCQTGSDWREVERQSRARQRGCWRKLSAFEWLNDWGMEGEDCSSCQTHVEDFRNAHQNESSYGFHGWIDIFLYHSTGDRNARNITSLFQLNIFLHISVLVIEV